MKQFENGVRWYTVGTLTIYFPEDMVVCKMCQLYAQEPGTKRDYCKGSGESIPAPDIMIGGMCPINFITKPEGEQKEEEK